MSLKCMGHHAVLAEVVSNIVLLCSACLQRLPAVLEVTRILLHNRFQISNNINKPLYIRDGQQQKFHVTIS